MQDERGALARGLVVINQLSNTPGMSLEQLAKTTGYPKTSLFRIMRTLVEFSLVRRDADGRYQPLARIQPLTGTSFEDRLLQTMKRLTEETGQTVEWYEPGPAGMVITQRVLPKNTEIGVRARVGFIRDWNGELDAVLALGIAHLKPEEVALDFNDFSSYLEPFKQSRVSAKFAKNRI
jgi:DNA-binding IclR family transcriptional regulator